MNEWSEVKPFHYPDVAKINDAVELMALEELFDRLALTCKAKSMSILVEDGRAAEKWREEYDTLLATLPQWGKETKEPEKPAVDLFDFTVEVHHRDRWGFAGMMVRKEKATAIQAVIDACKDGKSRRIRDGAGVVIWGG